MANAVLESHAHQDTPRDGDAGTAEADGDGRRDRRSRDRYGRDRRERGDRSDRAEQPAQAQDAAADPPVQASPTARGDARPAEPAPAAARGLPRVQAFELPVDNLVNMAQGAQLEWVHSDSAKIAAVQAAMAAEPRPIRAPRERAPAVTVDDGPLVLVETKRDLRNLPLPF